MLRVGGIVDKVSVSLRIIGKNLDPDHVTRLLGVKPTNSHRLGDQVRPPYPVRSHHGVWLLGVKGIKGRDLESTLWQLLKTTGRSGRGWSTVLKSGRADAFCGLFLRAWNRGLELSPELLKELGRRRITLSLDIYGDDGRIESARRTASPRLSQVGR
jgi:uncharacterized protein DUF4279